MEWGQQMRNICTTHQLKISPSTVSITFQGEPHFLRLPSLLKLKITSQGGRMTQSRPRVDGHYTVTYG